MWCVSPSALPLELHPILAGSAGVQNDLEPNRHSLHLAVWCSTLSLTGVLQAMQQLQGSGAADLFGGLPAGGPQPGGAPGAGAPDLSGLMGMLNTGGFGGVPAAPPVANPEEAYAMQIQQLVDMVRKHFSRAAEFFVVLQTPSRGCSCCGFMLFLPIYCFLFYPLNAPTMRSQKPKSLAVGSSFVAACAGVL